MRLIDADSLPYDEFLNHRIVMWDDIERSKTIDAEPVRHGRWIECESENGIHFHKCSECGKRDMYQGTFTDWGGRGFSFYFKRQYCPVCGALMDEVNNENN